MGKSEKQMEDKVELSFEQALVNLEEIIQRMESGEAPLDSLVTNYQNGIRLLKFCRKKIESAEMKIRKVQEDDGELIEKKFDNLV
jgi:exodeoxyribonuclease VII small subunit